MGYGEIYTGNVGKEGDFISSYPHYWVQKGNKIYDPQRDLMKDKGVYWDIEKLKHREEPDKTLWDKSDYDFWRNRIKFK